MSTRTRTIVEKALKDYPLTRSSDSELLIVVARDYGLELSSEQRAALRSIPSLETLTRIRRRLQEKGLYPATDFVKNHRKFKGQQVQQAISKTRVDKIDQLINEKPEQTTMFGGAKAVGKKMLRRG